MIFFSLPKRVCQISANANALESCPIPHGYSNFTSTYLNILKYKLTYVGWADCVMLNYIVVLVSTEAKCLSMLPRVTLAS